MVRQQLSRRLVTEQAMELVEEDGFEALNVSSVAARLGVRPSALYTHINGLDGLRYLVAVHATENLTVAVRDAAVGTSGDDALSAMAAAYRHFAQVHGGQFASTLLPPVATDDDLARANRGLLAVFARVYAAMGLSERRARLAAGTTRSAIHGFLALEHTGDGEPGRDTEYQHLLEVVQRGLIEDAQAV